jgi:hypothetical protein
MAFATGTQVDPRLMQADLSGYTKAAEIQAQGMANFASALGTGVEKFAKKQKEKKAKKFAADTLVGFVPKNPSLADAIGLEYKDETGNFSEDILRKSAESMVETVGADQIGGTIINLLGLGVKAQTGAASLASQQREDKYDTAGFQNIVRMVGSLPDIYKFKDNQITLKSTGEQLTADMPEAEPFLNQPGSGFFGLYTRETPTPALQVGGGATPTGEIVEQDGIQYSKYSDGSFRPVN